MAPRELKLENKKTKLKSLQRKLNMVNNLTFQLFRKKKIIIIIIYICINIYIYVYNKNKKVKTIYSFQLHIKITISIYCEIDIIFFKGLCLRRLKVINGRGTQRIS